MNEVNQIGSSVLDGLSQQNRSQTLPKDNELGQDAFLQLLVTQLSNQDPLSPQENGEFIAQLAQFSSVEGIQNLNTSFESLSTSLQSNQALQASALVGRSVRLPTNNTELKDGATVEGTMSLPVSTEQIELLVFNSAGQQVSREVIRSENPAGAIAAGEVPLNWDGTDQNGDRLPAGTYRFEANALIDGEQQGLQTHLNSNVNSVTLGQESGVVLNIAGAGPVPLSDVTEIY